MGDNPGNFPHSKSEDYLLERKTQNDLKDLLKTMVAFANSVRPGHVATILIGEKADGTPEGLSDADDIQKKVRREADKIYPQIIWRSEAYSKDGKECLKVEIEYSGDTPHFGGPAWIRKGSESVLATDQEFQRLINIRSSVVRELDQGLGNSVTLEVLRRYPAGVTRSHVRIATLKFVNQFYVTLIVGTNLESYPLNRITLCLDDQYSRLKITVDNTAVTAE
jgi:hypothetical protein